METNLDAMTLDELTDLVNERIDQCVNSWPKVAASVDVCAGESLLWESSSGGWDIYTNSVGSSHVIPLRQQSRMKRATMLQHLPELAAKVHECAADIRRMMIEGLRKY